MTPVAGPPASRSLSLLRAFSLENVGNGIVAFVFAASGPLAIILATGARAGLSEAEIASWVFGAFAVCSVFTIVMSAWHRQPLIFFWTIPGTILVGHALTHASLAEVVGAYFATGLLMLMLGLTGAVGRIMGAVPLPIVMGMVAGVFLQFGIDLVKAFQGNVWIAAPMTAAFALVSALPGLARRLPPLLVALAVGIGAILWLGLYRPALGAAGLLVLPVLQAPALSWPVLLELVVPLAITVLVVQNGQGVAVGRAAGHTPPVDAIASACGIGTLLIACLGAAPTCLTGPSNAIVSATRDRATQWAAAIVTGMLAIAFGLMSPLFTRLLLATPPVFIATLAGLAMLRVLQTAFATAFQGRCGLGALLAFLVTVAGIPVLGIGAPFWGLVVGYATSRLVERADFAA